MKPNHYGYHASDCTLRFNGVRMAKLTTPDGRPLTIPFARSITDALNHKVARALAVAMGGLLDDVANLDDDARAVFGGPEDVSVVCANKAMDLYHATIKTV